MESQTRESSISIPSIIAILAAIGSFFSGALWGFILAMIAIVFGVIGVLLSLSPRYRGGIISVFSLLAAGVGIVLAVFKTIAWLV